MGKSDAPGFAELIDQAQQLPTAFGHDIANPFKAPLPPGDEVVNLDEPKVPGVPKLDYQAHVEHFYIPKDATAYEQVLNKVLNAQAILRYEDRNFTKEGDCIVVICYLTYTPKKKTEFRLRRDEDDQD
jgi:hypothetical protein